MRNRKEQRSIEPVSLYTLLSSPYATAFINPYVSEENGHSVVLKLAEKLQSLRGARPIVIELTKNLGVVDSANPPFFVIIGVMDYTTFEQIKPLPHSDFDPVSYQWECIGGLTAAPLRSGWYKIMERWVFTQEVTSRTSVYD